MLWRSVLLSEMPPMCIGVGACLRFFRANQKTGREPVFSVCRLSGFFGGHLGIVSNQCHQGILLTTRQLSEALQ